MPDVAKRAGVGTGTVSRVINNDPHVTQKTREAVEKAIRELNYVPNSLARGLKTKRSKTIGIIVADITNAFFSKIIRGIEDVSQENGYGLLLLDTGMQIDKVRQCIELLDENKVDGIFILGEHLSVELLQKLMAMNVTVVVATMQVPVFGRGLPPNFASITINNERAAFCATDFLCKQGYKNIAMLMSSMEDENVGLARYTGYRNALSRNNIPIQDDLVYCSALSLQDGYDGMKYLIQKGIKFDSVFAASDLSALGALRALYELGFSVPDEVAVIGFDGIEHGKYSIPSLTTIDQPRYLMGKVGTQVLIDIIENREVINREMILDFEFIERGSTKKNV